MLFDEKINEVISASRRDNELFEFMIDNDRESLTNYIDMLVRNAYIAGYQNSRQLGLNIPVEERANEYCKLKGLRE